MTFPMGQDFDSDTFFLLRKSKKPPKTKTDTTQDRSSFDDFNNRILCLSFGNATYK